MFRVADRPATHAGSKLHKFNRNRRGERPRFIATLPIGHELRGSLLVTAERAFGCGSFSRAPDFGHFLLSQPLYWRRERSRVGPIDGCYLSLSTRI